MASVEGEVVVESWQEAVEASKAEVGTTLAPTAGNFNATGFKGGTRRAPAVAAEPPDLTEEPRG